jgi:hypothetical protein
MKLTGSIYWNPYYEFKQEGRLDRVDKIRTCIVLEANKRLQRIKVQQPHSGVLYATEVIVQMNRIPEVVGTLLPKIALRFAENVKHIRDDLKQ